MLSSSPGRPLLRKSHSRTWNSGCPCHQALRWLSTFTFQLQNHGGPSLKYAPRSLLGSPVLPSRKALPLILLACLSPSLLCPGRISNFSSAGAYLEGSLAVCTKRLKNLQIL